MPADRAHDNDKQHKQRNKSVSQVTLKDKTNCGEDHPENGRGNKQQDAQLNDRLALEVQNTFKDAFRASDKIRHFVKGTIIRYAMPMQVNEQYPAFYNDHHGRDNPAAQYPADDQLHIGVFKVLCFRSSPLRHYRSFELR